MDESYIERTQLLAVLAWLFALLLLAAACLLVALGPPKWDRWAMMLAACACVTSGLAATLSVKGYTVRALSAARAAAGLNRPDGPSLMR